jgi:hypothetical protein
LGAGIGNNPHHIVNLKRRAYFITNIECSYAADKSRLTGAQKRDNIMTYF